MALVTVDDRTRCNVLLYVSSPAAEVGNPASLDTFFSLLIISLWDICNNIQVGVEFLPLGN